MKIITWNCNMAFRKKATCVLALNPDILVIPECEHPDKLLFPVDTPKPTNTIWFGKNRNKGLGVFSYGKFKLTLSDIHNPAIKTILPISARILSRIVTIKSASSEKFFKPLSLMLATLTFNEFKMSRRLLLVALMCPSNTRPLVSLLRTP